MCWLSLCPACVWFLCLSHWANHEIPRLLWDPKFHCRVHKSPPLVPLVRQMNLVHIFPSNFSRIHSNIILLRTPRSSRWFLRFGFPIRILYEFLTDTMRATCPAYLILLDLITLLIFVEAYAVLSSLPLFTSSLVPIFSSAPWSQAPLIYVFL
jgi:hypothetical protein